MQHMARNPANLSPSNHPEFAVRWETISRFFDPPMARSTFHDFVNKGKIIPMKGIRGFYLLNESLRRLGLREVAKLPVVTESRSIADIVRLAFHLLDPDLIPMPSWMMGEEDFDFRDFEHAAHQVDLHREAYGGLQSPAEKLAYIEGVLDAYTDAQQSASVSDNS